MGRFSLWKGGNRSDIMGEEYRMEDHRPGRGQGLVIALSILTLLHEGETLWHPKRRRGC
jgi:hypothetical protein